MPLTYREYEIKLYLMTNTNTVALHDVLATLEPALDVQSPKSLTGVTSNMLAVQIREDLKAATKAGLFPKGTRFSVRQNAGMYYSARCGSITVSIAAFAAAVYSDDHIACQLDGHRGTCKVHRTEGSARYSEAFRAALDNAQRIADRHNYNRSDLMSDYFDVGYYLNVHGGKAESAASEALREEAAAHAAYRATPAPRDFSSAA